MRIPTVLFLSALACRVAAGLFHPEPAYPDSYYYVNVARQLADGNGFTLSYIWNFVDVGGRLPAQPELPIDSNAHWMPISSLIQVPFIWLLGDNPIAYSLPFWLIGALVAPVTYWLARDAGLRSPYDVLAAAFTLLPGMSLHFMSQPDNFAPFMLLGAVALWLGGRALAGDLRALAAGGLVVGLATLSRNDGVLLGVPLALAGLGLVVRGHRSAGAVAPALGASVLCAAGFAVVAAPWYLRQLLVFGSLSPSAASGRILWIRDYNELWSVSSETTLASFLAQGAGALLVSRLQGLASAIVVFGGAALVVFLVPFVVAGWWSRRRDPRFGAWAIYLATLFAFNSLLFAVHVPFGTFYHSAVALLPHAFILGVIGIGVVVRWVAARRRHWNGPLATRNFTVAALVLVSFVSLGSAFLSESGWRIERAARIGISRALDQHGGSGQVVMSPDPGAYAYYAGSPGIVTPLDPLPVVAEAARAYDARWLVLERRHLIPSLTPVYLGEQRPDWISAPIATVGDVADSGDKRGPDAVLFALCLTPSDARCGP